MSITLTEMTRARMHELYRSFTLDPDIFPEQMPPKRYRYDPAKVDALYDMRFAEANSLVLAILADGAVIGEVGLRKIDRVQSSCELSIHLQNDTAKNKGYGTVAEQLAVSYAFETLGLQSVWAETLEKNRRSQHVLEKLGFRYQQTVNGYKQYQLYRKDWK